MPSKPPFDMTTTTSPGRASLAMAATMAGVGQVAGLDSAARRSATSLDSDSRSLSGSDERNTEASTTWSATANARAKSCWNTRRHEDADRGSNTAQMRRPGVAARTAASVSATAVGW